MPLPSAKDAVKPRISSNNLATSLFFNASLASPTNDFPSVRVSSKLFAISGNLETNGCSPLSMEPDRILTSDRLVYPLTISMAAFMDAKLFQVATNSYLLDYLRWRDRTVYKLS